MICYNCGANLTRNDFCTNCGADVAKYKKIMSLANMLYNRGLEKAGVRDLSGAVGDLRQCLKLDKSNVDARNLLGLIYYETGEYVEALTQWVISKNLRPDKNIADDYIGMVQDNLNSLDAISQVIKKYNQALSYCYQGMLDLAMIQLKNVLSSNPNYVQARQLMALICLQEGHYAQAKRELLKCKEVDINNTTTLRYLREAESVIDMDEGGSELRGKKRKNNVITYQVDNDTIIQPAPTRSTKLSSTIINIVIGMAIGLAAACLLILPARISAAREGLDDSLKAANEQIDAKSADIAKLEQDVKALEAQNSRLASQLEVYVGEDGSLTAMDSLLSAVKTYLNSPEDTAAIADYLDSIDQATLDQTSDTFEEVYNMMLDKVGSNVSVVYYEAGMKAYQADNYEDAIVNLTKAYAYDGSNEDALFALANSYRKLGDTVNAIDSYTKLIEIFPDTDRATRAQQYINELNVD